MTLNASPQLAPVPISRTLQENQRVFRSEDLLHGAGEVVIRHRDQIYRLRLTSNDKLILVK